MAMGVNSRHNQVDMTDAASGLWIESGNVILDHAVSTGPRIGMGKKVTEPWFSMPWHRQSLFAEINRRLSDE